MTVLEAESAVDRFDAPLYTLGETSRYLGVPESTLRSWSRGRPADPKAGRTASRPIVTAFTKLGLKRPEIPFIGLAEGYALAAIRKSGVPLQRIRPALERLDAEMGMTHALASQHLFTDGAEVLFDYADKTGGEAGDAVRELVVVRDGQHVFREVVSSYLQRIVFGTDGLATAVPLPGFGHADLVADVHRGFGQPIFSHGGARVEDVLSLFRAGEELTTVAEEYGIPYPELEDVVRKLLIAG